MSVSLRLRLSLLMFLQYAILGLWAVTLPTFLKSPPNEGGLALPARDVGLLYGTLALGVRYMTLTHSETLDWADSATDKPKSNGLSPFGEQVVAEMNRLGMLVDISHVSPETMKHALRVTKAPIIASHSSVRALANASRNMKAAKSPLLGSGSMVGT